MKVTESESCSVVSDSLRPHGLYSLWILKARTLEWVAFSPSPGDLLIPGIEPRSPTLQVILYQLSQQGKPKNTGMGSISLLQQIFLTQELNQGLLHCRRILYQLSYQGSQLGTRGQAIRYEATLSRSWGGTVRHTHRCSSTRSQGSRLV